MQFRTVAEWQAAEVAHILRSYGLGEDTLPSVLSSVRANKKRWVDLPGTKSPGATVWLAQQCLYLPTSCSSYRQVTAIDRLSVTLLLRLGIFA
jgi:hypothetical protein